MFDHDHLMKSEQIFDDFLGKDQACVNCDFFNRIKELEEAGNGHSYKLVQIEDPDNLVSFQLQDEEGNVYGDTIRIPNAQILIDSGFKIVESLPESGPDEEDKNKIFLVLKESEEESDVYDEYIWVNDKWELIGSSKITVDLSDYLKKDEASKLYQPKEDSKDPYVKESALTDFAKIIEVDGKKVLILPESVQIMGTVGTAIYALLSLRTYNQESGENITQAEVGTTSYHLNLNSLDNITVDTPEGKKTLVFSEDLSNFLKIITVDEKEVVNLPQNVQLMGTVRDAIYALVSLRVYNEGTDEETIQVEIGTISQHLNLNTKDNITYDTPEGKKTIANLDDLKDNLKIVEVNGKKVVTLPESVQLMGTIGEAIYALAAIQKYAQEEGADLIQVEMGTTSFHLNLNTADNITYDTPTGKKTLATDEVATSEKKGLLSSEDKAKLDKVDLDTFIIDLSNSDEAKQVHLALVEKYKDITEAQPVQGVYVKNRSNVGLLGKTNLIPITGVSIKSDAPHFFCDLTVQFQFGDNPAQSCFGNLEFYFEEDGTAVYMTSNTLINDGGDILNYEDGGLVAKAALKYLSDQRGKIQLIGVGGKVISELDADLYSIPWRVDLPIRTPLNKVFEESEILEWFHVESVSELKTVVNTRNLYMKYGILLTGQPMYYNMPIQYAAFESNTQIKLVWVGLNTSNDAATRYTFIVNLNGTIIENGCNASLVLEELALKSDLPSFTVIEELTEDYVIPANPTSKEFTYEIHVGETVYSITGAAGIIWQNGEAPNVQANHIYAVSVINNLAVWGEF